MRRYSLFLLLALASCSGATGPTADVVPGLDIADAALANGAPDSALRIADRILEHDPRNVAALVHKGDAETALGQRNGATQSYSRALELAPDDANALLGLGRLKLANDPLGAAGLFERLANRNPPMVAALVDLGIARDLQGQHAEAQKAYRRALAIEPEGLAATVNLGLSLALSGNPQQALEILRPVAAQHPTSPRVRQDLAVAFTLAGDSAAAQAI